MNNFIRLSDLKEKKLKENEMRKVNGGYLVTFLYGIDPVLEYGIIDNPPY